MIGSFRLFLLALVWLSVHPLLAQTRQGLPSFQTEKKAAEPEPLPTAEEITSEQAETRRLIETNRSARQQSSNDHLEQSFELLRRLAYLLQEQQRELDRRRQLQEEHTELTQDNETLRLNGPEEQKPYSFLLLDRIEDRIIQESNQLEILESVIQTASRLAAEAKDNWRDAQRELRSLREKFGANPEGIHPLELGELENRRSRAAYRFRLLQLENEKLNRNCSTLKQEFLKTKRDLIAPETLFLRSDLESVLDQLEKREQTLGQELEKATAELQLFERRWFLATEQLESQPQNEALAAEVEARRLARQVVQRQVLTLRQQLQRLQDNRTLWERRYLLADGPHSQEQMTQWLDEADLEATQRERRLQETYIENWRVNLGELDHQLDNEQDLSDEQRRWLEAQANHIRRLIDVIEDDLVDLNSFSRLKEKLRQEIRKRVDSRSFQDQLLSGFATIRNIWDFEITAVDDKPITVGKIVMGLLLLILGIWTSRWASRILGSRFLPRLGLNRSAAAAFQTVAFYGLIVTFTLFSLELVNVPLTVFTLLGGALAIGIGFGSQNIMNNFISGLILLAERPIKIGDSIQVDNLYGSVVRIGARSTRIRTASNIDIIVPNSAFLEQNVINWTLGDDQVRSGVKIGVAYGSPVKQVRDLLLQAVGRLDRALGEPKPLVLFRDFGDNALIFEVLFWIHMESQTDRQMIESNLRFIIDELFHEHKITIAFPQRDVHLDTLSPLAVELVRRREPPSESESS